MDDCTEASICFKAIRICEIEHKIGCTYYKKNCAKFLVESKVLWEEIETPSQNTKHFGLNL